MAERISVEVKASPAHPDILVVEDALDQLRSSFTLLPDTDGDLVWAVVSVSMASPFTFVAEAKSIKPGIDVSLQAYRQKETLGKRLRLLQQGIMPVEWVGTKRETAARELLKRNANGIGVTQIILEPSEPPVIFEQSAAQKTLDSLMSTPHRFLSHQEIGTVEGNIIGAGTYNRRPALSIRDRRNGETVTCLVPQEVYDLIVSEVGLRDVWERHRVSVRGKLYYNDKGIVERVETERIEGLPATTVSLADLYDTDFTEGLDPVLYLERLREGA